MQALQPREIARKFGKIKSVKIYVAKLGLAKKVKKNYGKISNPLKQITFELYRKLRLKKPNPRPRGNRTRNLLISGEKLQVISYKFRMFDQQSEAIYVFTAISLSDFKWLPGQMVQRQKSQRNKINSLRPGLYVEVHMCRIQFIKGTVPKRI